MVIKKLYPILFLALIFGCKKDPSPIVVNHAPFVYTDSVADIDGNYYHTVTIGSHVWMAENLRTTRYQNGDLIDTVQFSADWELFTNGKCCNYNNDSLAESIYGKLYNYYAVSDSRNIAPVGWHVATYGDWQSLVGACIDSAGQKLREFGHKHWYEPNDLAKDPFGFAALPGGYRDDNGYFLDVRNQANFWSSTYYIPSNSNYPESWMFQIQHQLDPIPGGDEAVLNHSYKVYGYSIRCVKD